MLKRHKDFLRAVVTELRHVLAGYADRSGAWQRGELDRELERLGIAADGTITPLDSLPNPTDAERRARYVADAQLASLLGSELIAGRTELVERAAYCWINRLLALRVMEARGLTDETLRSNPEYGGVSEALYLLRMQAPDRAAGADGGWWAVVEGACAAQSATLPGLFDPRDPAVALRPSTPALLRCVALVGNALPGYTIEEADAAFADPDAIGWAYQFYQEEAKARTYAKFGSGGKAETRSEIASATQLFTERYMVQWLLQNSLGRSYHEAYADSRLPDTWDYFVRRPDDEECELPPSVRSLSELTVMDPCMGSGHFLREAFDMLVAMYREQQPGLNAAEIANRILSHHLHGVDIDPRAAQLAALTLYLRAWELVREEQRALRRLGPVAYRPRSMNLATSPTGLSAGAVERHLRRHPEDLVFRPLLEGIFAALEKADLLGSLLQPGAQLDAAIAKLQQPHTIAMDFDAGQSDLRRTITDLASQDPAELKRMLLDRIAASFAAEVGSSDVGADLFGREAEQGVRLLELLDRRYAVVVTNPPYMGSGNMGATLKRHVEQHYAPGKRDVYAAFILRCIRFCQRGGRVAMVTMQGWMFSRSYADLRSIQPENRADARKSNGFTGVLRETSLEALAHLGRYAFSEIGNAVVAPVLFTLAAIGPPDKHTLWTCRMVARRPSEEQATLLLKVVQSYSSQILMDGIPSCDVSVRDTCSIVNTPAQTGFLSIPLSPMCYWLHPQLLQLLVAGRRVADAAYVYKGLDTADNDRFTRLAWEVERIGGRWFGFPKGGGYQKWTGKSQHVVDWESAGTRIKAAGRGTPRNESYYGLPGLTYTEFGSGCLGVRYLKAGEIFNTSSPGIIVRDDQERELLAGILNCRVSSYLLRSTQASVQHLGEGYVAALPHVVSGDTGVRGVVVFCLAAKTVLIETDPAEADFRAHQPAGYGDAYESQLLEETRIASVLLAAESLVESMVFRGLALATGTVKAVTSETGVPAGWLPLLEGYDHPPLPSVGLGRLSPPEEVLLSLAAHERVPCPPSMASALKAKLRLVYELGPMVKNAGQHAGLGQAEGQEGEDDAESAAQGAIPTETFVEDICLKLQIHPVSVYWLLRELRADGARCKPEERRMLEDRLSVLLLRLLGHRWPRQIKAGEPVSDWADSDGIIPLTLVTDEPTAAEMLRDRLRAEDGDLGAQGTEALLQELTGLTLEEWVRRQFFPRHVRQFKYHPIAWHLASVPQGSGGKRKGARRQPAFECLVYYHACTGDILARLRSQYLQPLILMEQRRAEDARKAGDETTGAVAAERIAELEAFSEKLRQVDEEGFGCQELDELVAAEPLDRWSGDGHQPPSDREDLLRREGAWHVDINDGVRVNIAPIQLAGVIAADVLKAADARKAIADRARWRADERRWVREGKLPRCGWMGDDVPESPRWRELAPQREAERRKLEEKRGAASERLL